MTKKAEKSEKPKTKKKKEATFELLSSDTQTAISEAIDKLSTRSSLATKFHAGDVQVLNMLKLPLFYLQWMLGSMGLLVGRIVEVFGPEAVGKSSFLYWLFGMAMNQNVPCLYIETERKYTKERIAQFLSPEVEKAKKLLKALTINQPMDVVEMAENIKTWVSFMRDEVKVPMAVPLLVGIDTFSALQTKYERGDKRVSGDAKMGDHAKFAAAWMREWPAFAEQNGVVLVILGQQKDKIQVSTMPGMVMGADVSDRFNKTKIGGRAFNFHSTHQIVMVRRGFVRGEGNVNDGDRILLEVVKNCLGRPRQQVYFDLLWRSYPTPEATLQQCPIKFEGTCVEWMASSRLFGIHPSGNNTYTSKELNLKEAKPAEVLLAVQLRPDLVDVAGKAFRIYGYDNTEIPPCVAVAGGEADVRETDGEDVQVAVEVTVPAATGTGEEGAADTDV